jgi:hypothetical protein
MAFVDLGAPDRSGDGAQTVGTGQMPGWVPVGNDGFIGNGTTQARVVALALMMLRFHDFRIKVVMFGDRVTILVVLPFQGFI